MRWRRLSRSAARGGPTDAGGAAALTTTLMVLHVRTTAQMTEEEVAAWDAQCQLAVDEDRRRIKEMEENNKQVCDAAGARTLCVCVCACAT